VRCWSLDDGKFIKVLEIGYSLLKLWNQEACERRYSVWEVSKL